MSPLWPVEVHSLTPLELVRGIPELKPFRDEIASELSDTPHPVVPFRGTYLREEVLDRSDNVALTFRDTTGALQGFLLASDLRTVTAAALSLSPAELRRLRHDHPGGYYVGNFFARQPLRGHLRPLYPMGFGTLRAHGARSLVFKTHGTFLRTLQKDFGARATSVPGVWSFPVPSEDLCAPPLAPGQKLLVEPSNGTVAAVRALPDLIVGGRRLVADEYRRVGPLLGSIDRNELCERATGDDWGSFLARWHSTPRRGVALAVIENRCASGCTHCFFGGRGFAPENIDFPRVARFISESREAGRAPLVYAKEVLGRGAPTAALLALHRLAGTRMVTTRCDGIIDDAVLRDVYAAGIRRLALSLQATPEAFTGLFRDRHMAHAMDNAARIASFRIDGRPAFQTVVYMVLQRSNVGQMAAMADLALKLGVGGVTFLRLATVGRARGLSRADLLDSSDLDRVLLQLIDLRGEHQERLRLSLGSPGFGPNYFARGIWKVQLGAQGTLGVSSRHPCPVRGGDGVAVSFPEARPIVCHTLAADAAGAPADIVEKLREPRGMCSMCALWEICRGGCVRNLAEGPGGLRQAHRAEQPMCVTNTLAAWNRQLLGGA